MFTLVAILVLAVLVLVHESGHFMAARLLGIYVTSFSIGFGPELWKFQGKETEYALRAIPLGGFVGFPDDEEESSIPASDPNLMRNRPLADRAIVIGAGIVANLFFAYFLLVVMTMTVGVGAVDQPGIKLVKILQPDGPAAVAGLQQGDVVLGADRQKYGTNLGILEDFQKKVAESAQKSINLTVKRQDKVLHITVKPEGEAHQGKIGVLLDFIGKPYRQVIRNPLQAMAIASGNFERLIQQTVQGLVQLATNFQESASKVAGPVAIVAMGSEIARSDLASLFDFTAIVSINLAIINLLPLPALDGGQLLFLLLEILRGGKPLSRELQDNVMQGGLVFFLGLGVLMIFRDSIHLLSQYNLTPF